MMLLRCGGLIDQFLNNDDHMQNSTTIQTNVMP